MYDVYKYLFYLIFISNGSSFVVVFAALLLQIDHSTQGCADGGAWERRAPINIFKFARKLVKKVSQAARGLATAFSVTFLFLVTI